MLELVSLSVRRCASSWKGCAVGGGRAIHTSVGQRRKSNVVLAIDLGTSKATMAAFDEGTGKPFVIPNAEGGRTTPSVVAYSKSGEVLIGDIAKRQAVWNPANTFHAVSRFVGRQPTALKPQLLEQVSYSVEAQGAQLRIHCPHLGKKLAPEEILAQLFRKLAADAGKYLGVNVNKAWIAAPTCFNRTQHLAIKSAGEIAGLDVLGIVPAHSAAAMAYLHHKSMEAMQVMTLDLGGGTLDVSVLEASGGVIDVLATNGDSQLGGEDFDKRIVDWLAEGFLRKFGVDLREDRQALLRLREAAAKAKVELSDVHDTKISLMFPAGQQVPWHIEENLSRAKFEELCADLFDRCTQACKQACMEAGRIGAIDHVVLAGGSTRMPAIKVLTQEVFDGKKPPQRVNPDEVVALGAAVNAGVYEGQIKDMLMLNAIPHSLGVMVDGQCSVLIRRGTTIPNVGRKVWPFTRKLGQRSMEITIFEGESGNLEENAVLGVMNLDDIPPNGNLEVELDCSQIDLSVRATLSSPDKELKVLRKTIQGILSRDDVARMKRDAEIHAAEVEKYKSDMVKVKMRAKGSLLVERIEGRLQEIGDKVLPELKSEVIDKMVAWKREAAKADASMENLDMVTKDLEDTWMQILEHLTDLLIQARRVLA